MTKNQEPSTSRGPLSFLADTVARINVSVHVKLLAGFFMGAMLVLGISILTLIVISSMNHQVEELTKLQQKVESTGKKNNLLTSQLHFRAISLLANDDSQNVKIAEARVLFA